MKYVQKGSVIFLFMGGLFFGETYGDQSAQKDSIKKGAISLDLPFSSSLSMSTSQKKSADQYCPNNWNYCEEEIGNPYNKLNSFLTEEWVENPSETYSQVKYRPNQIALSEHEKFQYNPLSMAKKSM
ncbi:MAG: hypothetical protein B7Y25_02580 [Alphaproteobacteria bacterium 16-39-46]|nr:MAG: hypothetical protein B7Y25_02580 [Alphaproteobacteria bacterium 16-39-46]OZA42635.1 MAG: hypothetical protein B7X84_05350 [Alphaproteobacteria bacterium 17-39-52]HQS83813.1 hypothetical protein [Alphaproteobacteria bacterium]HQS93689.1 hypothetical protein [Alphaproteobacteria bacterium]